MAGSLPGDSATLTKMDEGPKGHGAGASCFDGGQQGAHPQSPGSAYGSRGVSRWQRRPACSALPQPGGQERVHLAAAHLWQGLGAALLLVPDQLLKVALQAATAGRGRQQLRRAAKGYCQQQSHGRCTGFRCSLRGVSATPSETLLPSRRGCTSVGGGPRTAVPVGPARSAHQQERLWQVCRVGHQAHALRLIGGEPAAGAARQGKRERVGKRLSQRRCCSTKQASRPREPRARRVPAGRRGGVGHTQQAVSTRLAACAAA